MTRVLLLLLLAAAVGVWAPASAQQTPSEPAKAPALSLDDLLTLLASGVTPARAATLVKERGVSFELTEDAEKKLRLVGADDALLLAIARAKPAPPAKAAPEPEPARPPPAPVDKARAALEKAIENFGGLATLEKLRDFTAALRTTVPTPSGEMTFSVKLYWLLPDKVRNDIETPNGVLTMVWNGNQGWRSWQGAVEDLTSHQIENGRRQQAQLVPRLLLEAHLGQRTAQYVGAWCSKATNAT